MTRVLMTCFEPFGGHPVNSSFEVARLIAASPPDGVHLDWLVLPVVARECVERAWRHAEAHRPAFILALGQATGSPLVRLEDRGINRDHFSFADNAGNLHLERPVIPGGPAHHRTAVPLERLVPALRGAGWPVEHSFSAGSYVCNHYYYQLLHRTSAADFGVRSLFVHLPLLPEQVRPGQKFPSRPLAEQVECVRQVLLACLG